MRSDEGRAFLQAGDWHGWKGLETGQRRGDAEPTWCRELAADEDVIPLPAFAETMGHVSVRDSLQQRRSVRRFSHRQLTLEELSFLLWSVQGISGEDHRRRTAPSAGARHPLETYIVGRRIQGLSPGIYWYHVERHGLVLLGPQSDETISEGALAEQLTAGCLGQSFVGAAPACFVWTARPARSEWRYGPLAPKLIVLDVGHAAQNLYLAAVSIGAGTCAIGAYDQQLLDKLLAVDGVDEMVVYASPVGFPE